MEPVNDELPEFQMPINEFTSGENEKKYELDTHPLQYNKEYYVIGNINDKKNRIITKVIYEKLGDELSEDKFVLKELGTGRIINDFGGAKWIDVSKSSFWGGKRKSRSQKRKKTRSQKTRRIRKRTTKKRH